MASDKSPYELLRESKIARNRQRLLELGLLQSASSSPKRRQHEDRRGRSLRKGENLSLTVVRRSPRTGVLVNRKSTNDDESESSRTTDEHMIETQRQSPKQKEHELQTNGRMKKRIRGDVTRKTQETFTNNSAQKVTTRMVDVDVDGIVSKYLGRHVPASGKASVVNLAASLSTPMPSNVSFNKYSGVLEWGNALFLWVNLVESGGCGRVNDFISDGKQMTWFGGSRMHDDTQVIRRLIKEGKKASLGINEPSDKIVLWCRFFDEGRRAQPYVCLGRVGYQSHVPGSRPVKFVWNLIDYDQLVKSDSGAASTDKRKGQNEKHIFERIINF